MKHKTGVYYLRRRVPADLVKLVGKTEEKVSLRTKDPAEAKARHFAEIYKLEERWATMRKGQQALSGKQVQALVGDIYRAKVAEHADDPGSPETWRRLADDERRRQDVRRRTAGKPSALRLATGWSEAEAVIRARHGEAVDEFLADKGVVVSEADHRRILIAAAEATRLAHESILRNAHGDYSPDGNAERFPPSTSAAGPLKFAPVWADYQRQSKLRPATVKRWSPILRKFIAFVGVDDLRRITPADVIRWRDKMLSEGSGLDPITVRDVYLAAPKALLGFASDHSKIGVNPAANVTVKVKSKGTARDKDFRDEEAEKILSAALAPQNDLSSPELKDARRWIPWLCAYTGARVNEMTQLRQEDVMLIDRIWVVHITPEAGGTKTGFARAVPIHDHLIEQGFLAFAQGKAKGPLFYDSRRGRGGSAGNPHHVRMGQKIGEWVRAIGVKDPNVQPNHGWRHRFKTVGRTVGMDSQKLDFIQGHAADTEGRKYGRFPPRALKPEIDKIPRYEVVPAAALDRRRKASRLKSPVEPESSVDAEPAE
ncbi:DUF6538 domain-containing protein [Methylobacterium sp. J-070]|uniref:DUF6538 domain-containing protein n=1 Tax=Methylobacterium sp. J-070 TaxID=2836650 RepID=UPI001FBBDC6A|nr:DUF6538 domain-containing protein [Methylobacterium sp. J-070]MCJ2050254.1 integrase [Methylobacterium sp. J-070]